MGQQQVGDPHDTPESCCHPRREQAAATFPGFHELLTGQAWPGPADGVAATLLLHCDLGNDCGACLAELVEYAEVATSYPEIQTAFLLAVQPEQQQLQWLLARLGDSQPALLLDKTNGIESRFHLQSGSWVLLLDRQARLVFLLKPRQLTGRQNKEKFFGLAFTSCEDFLAEGTPG
jgi:hypothetical protein